MWVTSDYADYPQQIVLATVELGITADTRMRFFSFLKNEKRSGIDSDKIFKMF